MDKITYNTDIIKSIQAITNITNSMQNLELAKAIAPIAKLQQTINPAPIRAIEIYPAVSQYQQLVDVITNNSRSIPIINIYSNKVSAEDEAEINQTNEKVISEILQPDQEKVIHTDESPIITLSPVNDRVLKYLYENPEAFYQLSGTDFEIVMAEIYSKLGYDVTRTQSTRDGGKDLIIRKPETLGDFIYYVECKKFAPNRHVGVGIVRNFVGTVTTDRVNGGVIATTSFFTKDACEFIRDNKWDCLIKMHDYNTVRSLLNKVV